MDFLIRKMLFADLDIGIIVGGLLSHSLLSQDLALQLRQNQSAPSPGTKHANGIEWLSLAHSPGMSVPKR